jgi:hypothetical protein
MLIQEINTFCALLTVLHLTADFIALCDLYYEKVQCPTINYLNEAAMIMQGRDLYGVSRRPNGEFVVRRVKYDCSFPLSPSFAFWFNGRGEPGLEPESQSDRPMGEH